jgi:hypothetical protein
MQDLQHMAAVLWSLQGQHGMEIKDLAQTWRLSPISPIFCDLEITCLASVRV